MCQCVSMRLVSLVPAFVVAFASACGGGSQGGGGDAGSDSIAASDDGAGDAPAAPDSGTTCSLGGGAPSPTCVGTMRTVMARPYCVHVPASYVAGMPTAVLLLLHGYGVTGQIQAGYF